MMLLLKKINSVEEWSDSTAFTHSLSGYMWIVPSDHQMCKVVVGEQPLSTRSGAALAHVGALWIAPQVIWTTRRAAIYCRSLAAYAPLVFWRDV